LSPRATRWLARWVLTVLTLRACAASPPGRAGETLNPAPAVATINVAVMRRRNIADETALTLLFIICPLPPR
jgi:hypothetical protein